MMANLKYWLKGLAVAALSMVVYAGALGCYIALMLLVISMEEGGDNLSACSVSSRPSFCIMPEASAFTVILPQGSWKGSGKKMPR